VIIVSLFMQDNESIPEQTSHTAIAKERGKLPSSLIMSLFKRLYNFFGFLLTILIITLIVSFIAGLVLILVIGNVGFMVNRLLGSFLLVIYLLIFVVNIYYLGAGIVELILIKRKGGEENRLVNANRMILKGIVGIVVLFLLYFLISGISSFFGRDVQERSIPRSMTN
jgi:hypothetical protein